MRRTFTNDIVLHIYTLRIQLYLEFSLHLPLFVYYLKAHMFTGDSKLAVVRETMLEDILELDTFDSTLSLLEHWCSRSPSNGKRSCSKLNPVAAQSTSPWATFCADVLRDMLLDDLVRSS